MTSQQYDWEKWMSRVGRPNATCRLFCFPYAGAGSSIFASWAKELPAGIDVCPIQLPGRENRYREPCCRNLALLAETLSTVLEPKLDLPFALFGHSMGALVGFELVRVLRRRQFPVPMKLFVAARRAPQLENDPPFFDWPDEDFIREVERRYQSIPREILDNRDLRSIYLPILRADFELVDTYVYCHEPPLACPISAFGGSEDRIKGDDLAAWRAHTHSTFQVRMLPGNHFFLQSARQQLLRILADEMSEVSK